MFERLLSTLQSIAYTLPAVLISLMVHEVSHGWVSYKLGDPTAKQAGRLNLNPMKHLDLVGTLCMVFFKFGWAKPVPINPAFYKNKKGGIILVSVAGPLSNLLLAFISLFLMNAIKAVVLAFGGISSVALATVLQVVMQFLMVMVSVNITFAVFNLLPISPLDGSKILYTFLPDRIYYKILQYEQYGMIVLIALVWLGWLDAPLNFLVNHVYGALAYLAKLLSFWM